MRHAQLRAFHHVAVEGGFSRAAEALRLTQPAISDQVRSLEADYDVLLFDRRRKQVVLTEAGQRLLEVTRRLFEVENQARELLSEARALSAGRLRIIADSALHLLHVLAPFRERYPGVEVEVRTGNSQQVIAALEAYESDLGVLGDAPAGEAFDVLSLGSTPIIAFAARRSSAARSGSIGLAELALQPLVLRERGSKTRQKIEAAAAQRGIVLHAPIEAEGREAVREIVAAGAGVGVVSEAEFGHDPRLARIVISDVDIRMEESLVCLRDRAGGKLISAFMAIARGKVDA
jgi:LysR family transcriptional regulator, low CO2-responsive transcriptional regulator